MLGPLGARHRSVIDTFEEASEALGVNLWEISQNGPEEALNQTQNTQPALLAAGVACWRVWREQGGAVPKVMAGHSLGEYTALVAAGSLDFEDGIRLVAERGRRMQEAVPEGRGAMAAVIGLDDADVEAACKAAAGDGVVSAANYNAPGQVVIAGAADAVERALAEAKQRGAKRAMMLPVSVPSHCALMEPAAEGLAGSLEAVTFRPPEPAVLHNVDVTERADAAAIRDALLRQLYSPVRWTDTVHALVERGVTHAVECGPGKVLSGLARRIDRSLAMSQLGEPRDFETLIEQTGQ
jgi:[acyl-carrier-protein] S-malonyltransferase